MVSPPWKQNQTLDTVQERQGASQLLETSSQRQAFSHILRMLNSANEAKSKCEDERQRLFPKLLRMLKQTRKENSQLTKAHELAMQKARRDASAASEAWETKMAELDESHQRTIREYRTRIDEKDTECRMLRQRCDKLMEDVVLLEKKNTTSEIEKVDLSVKLKNAVSKAETRVDTLLQKQAEECQANLNCEKERNKELESSHIAHIRTLEERHADTIGELGLQILGAVTTMQQIQTQGGAQSADLSRLREEMMSIVHNVEQKTSLSELQSQGAPRHERVQIGSDDSGNDETSQSSKSSGLYEDYVMEVDRSYQNQQSPSVAHGQSSGASMFKNIRVKIAQLQAFHEAEQDRYRQELEQKSAYLEQNQDQWKHEYQKAENQIAELRTALSESQTKSLEDHRNHTEELRVLDQKLESCKDELIAAHHVNQEYKNIIDSLRKESEESKEISQREMGEHEQRMSELRTQLYLKSSEVAAAKDNISKLEARTRELQTNYRQEIDSLSRQIVSLKNDFTNERTLTRELQERILAAESDHVSERTFLQESHRAAIDQQWKEFERLRKLYTKSEDEKAALETDLSTQVMSIEAANNAEVTVLKKYTQELETSIEKASSSLHKAKARQLDLIEQLERLQSHVRRLGSSPTRVSSGAPRRNDHGEEGKENISILSRQDDAAVNVAATRSPKRDDDTPLSSQLMSSSHSDDPAGDTDSNIDTKALSRILFSVDSEGYTGRESQDHSNDSMEYEEDPANRMTRVPPSSQEGQESTGFPIHDSFEVEDWRERCYFLENDRDELVRVTDEIIEYEKESHQLQLEAAIATARREAMDQQRLLEEQTRHQIKNLYDALCSDCRHRIDTA